jgi:epoxide hydrolase-like predicted phosphatase
MSAATKIKAVLWDMGGVILRTKDSSFRKKWADILKVDEKQLPKMVFDNEKAHDATLGLITDNELWSWINNQVGLSSEDGAKFRKEFFTGDNMDWDLLKQIQSLRSQCKTGLLSNAWMDARQSLGMKYPGWDVFDFIFFSAEIHLMKPDQKIYQYVTDYIKVLPEETIFVDDQTENVEAANRFGIHGIRFHNSEQAMREVLHLLNS